MRTLTWFAVLGSLLVSACGGTAPSAANASAAPSSPRTAQPLPGPQAQNCMSNATPAPVSPGPSPRPARGLTVPSGFTIQIVANVSGARELAAAPNGDLFVGTIGSRVYVVQNAEGQASNPRVFATLPDSPAAGVALSVSSGKCAIFVGTEYGVYRIPYTVGDVTARAAPAKIAAVRTAVGGGHSTTSVAVANGVLYAGVGSSCNACTETDPTRATIQQMALDGSAMKPKAVRIRNAIALTVNPATQTVWAGDAGQDDLPSGHPYEFFDGVTLHAGTADYGWPVCEENHHAYAANANCASTIVPRVEFPAYETLIGAAFYPLNPSGAHAFPSQYRGGAFVAMHGSWHTDARGSYIAPPRVAFVPMNGDTPKTPVNWSNPAVQWSGFVTGFQAANGVTRIGRPTGLAVGSGGSLFLADDQTGNIYRIRP